MSEKCSFTVQSYSGGWPRFNQCSRSAAVHRDGKWFCWQHDPKKVAERDAERAKRDREKWEKQHMEFCGPLYARALFEIANGHNDPRGLARKALDKIYDYLAEKQSEKAD